MSTIYLRGKPVTWAFCPTCGMYRRMDEPHDCKVHEQPQSQPQPYRCPVCEGRGIVPAGFYGLKITEASSTSAIEPCRACPGTGIIWRDGNQEK